MPLAFSRRVPWRLLAGIVLAAASAVFLWHFPWRQSLSALTSARWGAVGLALLFKLFSVFARAERVHAMLGRVLRVGRGALVRYVFVGFAADNLLAATAGVAARTWLIVRKGGAPLAQAVGALMLEKWLDGVVIGAGIWATVHYKLIPVPFLEASYLVAYGIGLAILVFAIVAGRRGLHTRLGRWFKPAADAMGGPREATRTFVATATVWALEAFVLYETLRAFGLPCGVREMVVLTTAGTLAFVIPGLPSGAGTFEASLIVCLRLLGLSDQMALSVALLYHAVQVLPETAAGLWALHSMRVRLAALDRAVAQTENEVKVPAG